MKFKRDLEVRIMAQQENPIVFISYSQDSLSFADQVLSFANKLRSEGIDAILDQYEEAPSEGWPRWMENSINRADYVIVIGSKGYYDKIYTTNLTYVRGEIKNKEWFHEVNCSKKIAEIIDTLNKEKSISPLMNGKAEFFKKIEKI